jgi:thiamine biosynthesis lipoprotein
VSASPALATWRALGTSASVLVDDPVSLPAARASVEAELAAIDRACSRFRDDSELARVNSSAGRTVRVSPLFLEAIEAALRAARLSDGAVDPTVGEALILAGYDRDFALMSGAADSAGPAAPPRANVRVTRAPGILAIAVDRPNATVTVPRGVQLDLGASAKALAADRAAAAARDATDAGVLVSHGGDIATAGPAPERGWAVRVCDDHRAGADAAGQTVSIFSGGLATSSTTVRRWSDAGGERHHIIDPTRGLPAEVVWRTVSVAAGTCVDANTAATAAIVLGGGATEWLSATGLPARLVAIDGGVQHLGAWPSDEER